MAFSRSVCSNKWSPYLHDFLHVGSLLLAVSSLLHWNAANAFCAVRAPASSFHVRAGHHVLIRVQSVQPSATSTTTTAGDEDICTIQILMSDTGGGHRASANALRDALDVLHPGKIQVDIVDIYTDYGPFWPYNDVVAMYKLMAEYPFLWDAFYHFGATDFGICLNEWMLETFCFDSFSKCLARPIGSTSKRADMVVSVHPLCQDLPLKILASLDSSGKTRSREGRTTPFATVVTDLGGAHPTWFNKDVDKCFVPTDILYQCALDRQLQPSQLVEYGLPIRAGFWSTEHLSKEAAQKVKEDQHRVSPDDVGEQHVLRTELGLDTELPTVLVVGGGDGMGGIVDIARALGRKLGAAVKPSYQMVVVCGSNEAAKNALASVDWGAGVKVLVQGFVYNMDEWMKASDALVTKAGPGTIAEASICGLPCMLFNFLPGQEEGNVPYVVNSGFGEYSGDPKVIADKVSSWLASPEKLAQMKQAALKAARPSATIDIARDLAELVLAHKRQRQPQETGVA